MIDSKLLAKKHEGMRLNIKGLLRQEPRIVKISLEEIVENLELMAGRYYVGDIKAVDEFLQCYCLDKNRPKEKESEEF